MANVPTINIRGEPDNNPLVFGSGRGEPLPPFMTVDRAEAVRNAQLIKALAIPDPDIAKPTVPANVSRPIRFQNVTDVVIPLNPMIAFFNEVFASLAQVLGPDFVPDGFDAQQFVEVCMFWTRARLQYVKARTSSGAVQAKVQYPPNDRFPLCVALVIDGLGKVDAESIEMSMIPWICGINDIAKPGAAVLRAFTRFTAMLANRNVCTLSRLASRIEGCFFYTLKVEDPSTEDLAEDDRRAAGNAEYAVATQDTDVVRIRAAFGDFGAYDCYLAAMVAHGFEGNIWEYATKDRNIATEAYLPVVTASNTNAIGKRMLFHVL